jgi:hypothetical protein
MDSTLKALAGDRLPDVCAGADSNLRGAGDTPALRAAAATRYLHIYSMRDMMAGMADSMAVQIPVEGRKRFVDMMKNSFDYDAMNRLSCNALAKHFSVEEINALAAFYGSPAGRSAMTKFGPYMTDLMPGIMLEMQKAQKLAASRAR